MRVVTLYGFTVEALDFRWHVTKRFSEFYKLRQSLKTLGHRPVPRLPRRTFRRNTSQEFTLARAINIGASHVVSLCVRCVSRFQGEWEH